MTSVGTIRTSLLAILGVGMIAAVAFSQTAFAQVSPDNIVSYQGRILNANGVPVADATANMQFRLFDDVAAGSCLWSNDSSTCASNADQSVTLTDGLFSENLGDTGAGYAAIPDSVFADNASVFLEVEINGETLSPRKLMTAAPYALNAQTLDGQDASDFASSVNAFVNGGNSFGATATLGTNDANTLAFETNNSTRVTILSSGNVGVGTTSPGDLFSIGSGSPFSVDSSGSLTQNVSGTAMDINSTTAGGTLAHFTDNSLTSGVGLHVSSSSTALTGDLMKVTLSGSNVANIGNLLNLNNAGLSSIAKALNVTVSSTGAPTNGFVRFNFSGNHTNNGFQIDDVTTAGTPFKLNANSLTGGTAESIVTNALSSGTSLSVTSTSNALSSGKLLNLTASESGSSTTFTGSIANVTYNPTWSSGTLTHSGNLLNVNRQVSASGGTQNLTGAVVAISSDGGSAGGTLNDTGNVLLLTQTDVNATGALLSFSNSSTGGANDVSGTGATWTISKAGTITTAANLTVNGNTFLGDATTDTVTFTARAASSFLPSLDASFNLGSATQRWNNLFLGDNLSTGALHLGSSATDEGTIDYDTSTNVLNVKTDSTTNADIAFQTSQLYLDKSSGDIGIGDATPSATIDATSPETTGTAYQFLADSVTDGNGLILSMDGLQSGVGLSVSSTSGGDWNSDLVSLNHTASYTGTSDLSGNLVKMIQDLNVTSGTTTISGNVMKVTRSTDVSGGATGDETDPLIVVTDGMTGAGTKTSTADVVQLTQGFTGNTGDVLQIEHQGAGIGMRVTMTSLDTPGANAVSNQGLVLDTNEDGSGDSMFVIRNDADNNGAGTATVFHVTSNGKTSVSLAVASGANGPFALCHENNGAQTNEEIKDCNGAPTADYAEMYPVASGIGFGDVVAASTATVVAKDGSHVAQLEKSSAAYQGSLIGIVVNNHGDFTSSGYNIEDADNPMPVALVGRVPVKVNAENGPIAVGDPITSSSTAGVGMKATKAGRIVGYALESFDGTGQGSVLVFVSSAFYPGDGSTAPTAGTNNQASGFGSGGAANFTALNMSGNIYMGGNSILDLGKIAGLNGAWSVDEEGKFTTKGSYDTVIKSYQGEDVVTHAVLSRTHQVTLNGFSTIQNGTATVRFEDIDPNFNDITSTVAPVTVLLTPRGPAYLYVTAQDNDGFTVQQLNGADSDIRFDWMVSAYRKDYEPAMVAPTEPAPAEPPAEAPDPTPDVTTPPADTTAPPTDTTVTPDAPVDTSSSPPPAVSSPDSTESSSSSPDTTTDPAPPASPDATLTDPAPAPPEPAP